MNKRCPDCNFLNFGSAADCRRCKADIATLEPVGAAPAPAFERAIRTTRSKPSSIFPALARRFLILVIVVIVGLGGFYASLLLTSERLKPDERQKVDAAINVLAEKGYRTESLMLKYLTAFRSNDHWLNASTREENAYAATNFPYEIMTLYPEFFTQTRDDTERAAILLHEARHLEGWDEKEAYEFVWKNRQRLGWVEEEYSDSVVWLRVQNQTRDFAPGLFACPWVEFNDCSAAE
jgi:hypothetical protein